MSYVPVCTYIGRHLRKLMAITPSRIEFRAIFFCLFLLLWPTPHYLAWANVMHLWPLLLVVMCFSLMSHMCALRAIIFSDLSHAAKRSLVKSGKEDDRIIHLFQKCQKWPFCRELWSQLNSQTLRAMIKISLKITCWAIESIISVRVATIRFSGRVHV